MPMSPTKPSTPRLSDLARHVVVPSGIVSTGWPSVVAKCAELGIGFDPWQHGAGRIILSKRANGLYATSIGGVVISIPRQVGKTYMIAAIVFALCLLSPNVTVIWTAHRLRTANETFTYFRALAKRKKIAPFVAKIALGSGEEEIQFRNGSRILFGARERGFGVGFAEVDVLVVDEAQRATTSALDDMIPTTNQSKQPSGPLIFFMGTPPRPTDSGEVFRQKRTEVLSGEDHDTAYIEFSADSDAEPDDWEQVARANPSYPTRTPREAILRMRKNLTADSFLREGLGIWDEFDAHKQVIPLPAWTALAIPDAEVPLDPPAYYALAMSPDRIASIAVAVRGVLADYVDLAEMSRVDDSRKLIDWFVTRCGRRIPVMIDSRDPAASMVNELRSRGVKVNVSTATDAAKACGGLLERVKEARVQHCDQPAIRIALVSAKKKPVGKAGLWEWDLEDLSPEHAALRAITLALFGLSFKKRPSGNGRSSSGRKAVLL